jgi:hypothetical protein
MPVPTLFVRPSVRVMTAWLLAAVAGGVLAAPIGVTSQWKTTDIAIDGETSDWPHLERIEKGPSIGAVNDGEFLYLAVFSNDTGIRGPLATGLILWFDPAGGKAQTFGLRLTGVEPRPLPGMTAAPLPAATSGGQLEQFDILGPGKNQRRLVDITPALDISLAAGTDQGGIAYELKVPLASTPARTVAIGAGPGATIGLGIATPDAPRERGKQPLVGSSGYIGGNPYYAGANGGGFAPFADEEEHQKPLSVWTTLKLAEK